MGLRLLSNVCIGIWCFKVILGTRIWTGKGIKCSSEEDFDNNMEYNMIVIKDEWKGTTHKANPR